MAMVMSPGRDQRPSIATRSPGYESSMSDIRLDNHLDDVSVGDVHNLPNIEELKTELAFRNKPVPVYKKRWFQIAVIACGLIFFIGMIALAASPKHGVRSPVTGAASQSGSRMEDTKTFLLNFVNQESLTDTTSPQYKAAQWMANDDVRQVPLVQDQFLQRYALAVLWFATEGRQWRYGINFLSADHECDWHTTFQRRDRTTFEMGVQCDKTGKNVVAVILQTIFLQGGPPPELEFLTHLEQLLLDHNNMTHLGGLQSLRRVPYITLGYNQLGGDLPRWIGELHEVQVLGLSNNLFTGELPSELAKLTKLTTLAVDDNALQGNLDVLEQMTWLERLYLEDNGFTGAIDNDFLSKHTNLRTLDLSNNELHGKLGRSLLRHNQLEIIDLSGNDLSGSLPTEMPRTTSLRFLALHDNFLEGTIPPSMDKLGNLTHFDLSNNRLEGEIPESLSTLTNLEYVFLARNTHLEMGPIPDHFQALTNLRELSLKETARTGSIPTWINKLEKLILLDLDNNRLSSTLPKELSDLTSLNFLLLNRNRLTGELPDELGGLSKLGMFLLNENSLTGSAESLCRLKLPVFIADCDEVQCSCCTECCVDDTPCADGTWLSTVDPIWENRYTRDVYKFAEDVIFVPSVENRKLKDDQQLVREESYSAFGLTE